MEGFDSPTVSYLMSPDYRKQPIAFQKVTHCLIRVEVGVTSHVVVHKILCGAFLAKVIDRVRPQYVAHEPGRWRLAESIQLYGCGTVTGSNRKEGMWM
jgi:hypothetical protein